MRNPESSKRKKTSSKEHFNGKIQEDLLGGVSSLEAGWKAALRAFYKHVTRSRYGCMTQPLVHLMRPSAALLRLDR
jgi:hypothetical protein